MRAWNFTTFYGSYGKIVENQDGYDLEIIWNGYFPQEPFRKTYNTLKGAKIALGRMCESYRIRQVV